MRDDYRGSELVKIEAGATASHPLACDRGFRAGLTQPTETTKKEPASQHRAQSLDLQFTGLERSEVLQAAHDPVALRAAVAEKLGKFLKADCVGEGKGDKSAQQSRVDRNSTSRYFSSKVGSHRLDSRRLKNYRAALVGPHRGAGQGYRVGD